MTKDEIIFCINCVKTVYPGIWSDSPDKVQKLLEDVYEETVDINIIEELFNDRIIEEDEALYMYKDFGYE